MMSNCLAQAIFQYRAEWNGYLAATYDDDNAPKTYEKALYRLKTWPSPAESWSEAAQALELAIEFHDVGDSDVIPAMMKAALGWIEAEAERRASE